MSAANDSVVQQRAPAARNWIESILGAPLESDDFQGSLKNGIALCRLIDVIRPGLIRKVNDPAAIKYKALENIESFISAARKIGVPDFHLCKNVDLYEPRDVVKVLRTIYSLSVEAKKAGLTASEVEDAEAFLASFGPVPMSQSRSSVLISGSGLFGDARTPVRSMSALSGASTPAPASPAFEKRFASPAAASAAPSASTVDTSAEAVPILFPGGTPAVEESPSAPAASAAPAEASGGAATEETSTDRPSDETAAAAEIAPTETAAAAVEPTPATAEVAAATPGEAAPAEASELKREPSAQSGLNRQPSEKAETAEAAAGGLSRESSHKKEKKAKKEKKDKQGHRGSAPDEHEDDEARRRRLEEEAALLNQRISEEAKAREEKEASLTALREQAARLKKEPSSPAVNGTSSSPVGSPSLGLKSSGSSRNDGRPVTVIHQGHLLRKPELGADWAREFYVLQSDHRCAIFADENNRSADPVSVIDLVNATVYGHVEKKGVEKPLFFNVRTETGDFLLRGEVQEEKDAWVKAMKSQCVRVDRDKPTPPLGKTASFIGRAVERSASKSTPTTPSKDQQQPQDEGAAGPSRPAISPSASASNAAPQGDESATGPPAGSHAPTVEADKQEAAKTPAPEAAQAQISEAAAPAAAVAAPVPFAAVPVAAVVAAATPATPAAAPTPTPAAVPAPAPVTPSKEEAHHDKKDKHAEKDAKKAAKEAEKRAKKEQKEKEKKEKEEKKKKEKKEKK